MSTSQNGWPVLSAGGDYHYYPVPGTTTTVAVRKGAVAVIFTDLFAQLAKLEPAHTGWLWGWAVRPVRGQSSGYSNHASGTAIDWNAPKHGRQPFSRTLGWSKANVATIESLLLHRYDGVLRWGAQYQSSPYDPMHFEINVSPKSPRVNALAAKLLGDTRPHPTASEEVTVFIISRKDEAEEYLSDGFKRKWIPDPKHRDDYLALGVKKTENFATEGGLNIVGGPLVGPESPDKVARLAKGGN